MTCELKMLLACIIMFLSTNLLSQRATWKGIGASLSQIEIYEDVVKIQTFRDQFESEYDYLRLNSGELILTNKYNDYSEEKGRLKARFLDTNKDTLLLSYKLAEYYFINENKYVVKKPIKFEYFVFESLNSWRGTIEKIEFNKYGVLRVSDKENLTSLEVKVDRPDIRKFETIIAKIDIRNIYAADRMMNICDNSEYSFTFIDVNKTRYNYTAVSIRNSLEPIINLLNDFRLKYKKE